VAQTRRVLLAKALIHQTDLSMAQVALASGFGSVRRFNETFQALYGRPPSALRRRGERLHEGGVRLSLPYRPPYDWDAMVAALTSRGDRVEGRRWSRVLTRDVDGANGAVTVQPAEAGRVSVCVEADDLKALPGVLARVRRVFDLSADPEAIGRDLSADAALKPLVAARPGLRLPGDWVDDGAEAPNDRLVDETLAVRAEGWRPWRAYGALYLALAGIRRADLMENDDAKCAA
jgi:AraC family transcriptional regulator of adaptative response / DNA-3-methyladenine glycosylase II